ncbi:MAG: AMP-binding protein [Blastocatellia bacterium]|nr:AMP-binding protein [Blastocatellia bacterium]
MRETIISFLDDCAARPDETAMAHRSGLRVVRWSYERLRSTAFQFARELEARKVQKGDRVLFWAENSPEWIAAFFGCLLRGAIVVPLDRHSSIEFVSRVQSQVSAKLLLSSDPGKFDLSIPALPLDGLGEIVRSRSDAAYPFEDIGPNDLVEIIFTSGTTAEPKGVCLTHKNLLANLAPLEREIQKYIRWERPFHPVRFLNLVPLSHVFGQFMGIFVPQLLAGEVFFQQSLNPSEIIETVRRERISVIVAVPRQLEALREKIERDYRARNEWDSFQRAIARAEGAHFLRRWWMFRKIHSRFGWKFWAFVSGGATLDPETETFWQRLGYAVVQGYGMTETASIISVNHPFKLSRGSIGKTMPGQEVKLDASGEILVRGENVSPGYWSDGFKPVASDEGWLRTGDVGERDEEGNLYFRGRKKDVIVTAAGLNIFPEDLEAALNHQPGVRASCVIGVEGARGPEPLAVLIMDDDRTDAEEAVRRANQELSEYQHMRRWFTWPDQDFPRTATTHKIIKRKVAETVNAHLSGKTPAQAGRSALAELIAGIGGALDPSSAELKLDSLGRVELMSAIEDRYQIEMDEDAFTAATTIADIEKMIHEGNGQQATGYSYPDWAGRFPATWIRFIFYYLVILPITRLMCWVKVAGKDRLKDARGPVLFISNHVSMVDHGLILSALPLRFRHKLAIAMEGERLRSFRNPPAGLGWFERLRLRVQYVLIVALFNVFPLPQKSGFRRSFAFAGKRVDSGYSLLVFPEGKTTEDGRIRPFMGGIGLLASDLDLPVVPIKIEGLFELKQQGRYFARPGEVSVTFGEPVPIDRDEDPAIITRDLESLVAGLKP